MQILLSQAAHERVRDRLAAVAPDADIVTMVAPGEFQRAGQAVAPEAVDPEVIWLSLDAFHAGLLPGAFGRIMKGQAARWTQIFAAGIDAPIFKTIMSRGVRLTKSGAQSIPIAEYVVAHALNLLAPIEAQAALQREHVWKSTPYREIARTHWVLVGYGAIGHEIAARIKPFGVRLTVVRRRPGAEQLADHIATAADLPQLLPEADVVVLACALTDETRNLADAGFFQALKPGAILINVGRGGLVDEAALRIGLDRDQPAHAVLDVFATEPLPADSWFWDHPKVRVSAHTSNSGDGNVDRGDMIFLENLHRYLAGEPLRSEASPSEVGL
jgi:phosphoglycerate dehydrogenase-like enzyme